MDLPMRRDSSGISTAHHQSRFYRRFEHVLPLPRGTDPDRIEATLSDGLLTVRIPKIETGGGRRIDVRQI